METTNLNGQSTNWMPSLHYHRRNRQLLNSMPIVNTIIQMISCFLRVGSFSFNPEGFHTHGTDTEWVHHSRKFMVDSKRWDIYISLCRYGYNRDSHIHDKFRLISLNIKLPDTAIINSVSNKLDYFRVDATSIDSCTHSTFNLFLASYRVFFFKKET